MRWASTARAFTSALPPGLSYVGIAAGPDYLLARRSDGSVVHCGNHPGGPSSMPALPPGLQCVDLAACPSHAVALLSDGSMIAWGSNLYGECDVPPPPPGFNYVEIAAAAERTVARLAPIGTGNPLSLSITQSIGAGCGPIVISVAGAAATNELYNRVSLSYSGGLGPLFGVGLDAWNQLFLPLGTQPFHVLADAMGSYNLSIPGGCTTSVVIEAVTVEVVPGTFVIAGVSPTTGWVSLSL